MRMYQADHFHGDTLVFDLFPSFHGRDEDYVPLRAIIARTFYNL